MKTDRKGFSRPTIQRAALVVLILSAAGLAIRLIGLGEHSYWFDEAREILRAQAPWPDVLLVSEGADPPIYRLLLSAVAGVTLDEFWLRLPSAVFGAAAIYMAYVWLSELGQERWGVVTATLLAFAPVEIYYAQEVSQYTLSVLLAILLLISFERAARYGRWHDWVWLLLVSVLSVYSYYGLAWILPVVDIDLAWRTWKQRNRRRLVGFAAYHAAMAAAIAGLYLLALRVQFDRFAERKLSPVFFELGFLDITRLLARSLIDEYLRFFVIPWSPNAPDLVIILMGALFVAGTIVLWRGVRARRRILFLLLGVILSLFVAFGFGLYPFGFRYALLVTPLFFCPIAAALEHLWRWRPVGIAVTASLLVLFAFFLPNVQLVPNPWLNPPREQLQPVIAYVHQHAEQSDVIYVYYGASPSYRLYQPEPVFATTFGSWFRDWPMEDKLAEIHQVVEHADRFWLIASHIYYDEDDDLAHGLERDYELIDEIRTSGAAGFLFRRR